MSRSQARGERKITTGKLKKEGYTGYRALIKQSCHLQCMMNIRAQIAGRLAGDGHMGPFTSANNWRGDRRVGCTQEEREGGEDDAHVGI